MIEYFQPIPIVGKLTTSGWGIGTSGPRDPDNGIEDIANWRYWDGKLIKAPDGTYHLFCSKWPASDGIVGWLSDSVSVHATAKNVLGPYKELGLTYTYQSGKGHNTTGLTLVDGTYAVLWAIGGSGFVLNSDKLLGTFQAVGPSVYPTIAGTDKGKAEDPVIWYSGGYYHVVYNYWDIRRSYHIMSADGVHNWITTGVAVDRTTDFLRYADGTVDHWGNMERPNVYLENGHVAYFTFAVTDQNKDQSNNCCSTGSKVIVVPFDGVSFDADNGGLGGFGGPGGGRSSTGASGGDSGAAGTSPGRGGVIVTGVGGTSAGGAGGAPSSGGVSGTGGSAGSSAGQGGGGDRQAGTGSGCSCRTIEDTSRPAWPVTSLLLALGLAGRRSRTAGVWKAYRSDHNHPSARSIACSP